MASSYWAALRFARSFTTGWSPVVETEIEIERDGRALPASLLRPRGRSSGIPAWVVLHGITRSGRSHPYLLRFARALAATGAAVLVPEVPEWRELVLQIDATPSTIDASIRALEGQPEIAAERVGVVGFSFGAPQAIIASSDPVLSARIAGVVAFGGYHSLGDSARFQFSGAHELDGRRYELSPDPYGRWVVGANYLTDVPEYADASGVADALRELASIVGDRRLDANHVDFDEDKGRLAGRLSAREKSIFGLFAPPSGGLPDPEQGARLAEDLAEAMARVAPGLDPTPHLPRVRVPVRLLHGTGDQLFPYTETVKLGRAFPEESDVTTTVTGLFAHSSGGSRPSPLRTVKEGVRLFHSLARIFRVV